MSLTEKQIEIAKNFGYEESSWSPADYTELKRQKKQKKRNPAATTPPKKKRQKQYYLTMAEIAKLVANKEWEALNRRLIMTDRGYVRNSAKQLLGYTAIMEAGKQSASAIDKVRSAAQYLLDNPLPAGRKKTDIPEGYTKSVRLNPKQGQCLAPFVASYFGYQEGDKTSPWKNRFVTVTYEGNKIIIEPLTEEEQRRNCL